jgi:hypothetical protein
MLRNHEIRPMTTLLVNPSSISSTAMTNASVLLSLFADVIVPPAPHGTTEVPCSDKRVSIRILAGLELAWTFCALRDRGCIVLEPYEKPERVLFRKRFRPSVRARLGGAAADEGIEAELLQAVGADTAGSDVSDVVYRWIGKDDMSPFGEVTHRVVTRALELGYFQVADAHRGLVGRIVRGKTKLEPLGAAISAARPDVSSKQTRSPRTDR